jgi:Abortive infection alpha
VAAGRAQAGLARPRPQPRSTVSKTAGSPQAHNGQLTTAAGSAIVTAARVGRLLGRSGWRIAKQLPGVSVVEQQAQRLRQAAAAEMLRLLEVPQQFFGTASPEEQRVMMLVQNSETDPTPLRTAMSELLQRSSVSTDRSSRDYLFGTIVSQLVPDEARILATLAGGDRYAALDVVARQVGRPGSRTILANASVVGNVAGVSWPQNTPTYIGRLRSFGLLEFGPASEDLNQQFGQLVADDTVQAARKQIDDGKLGSAKLVRKTVFLSALGREFWTACAPDAGRLANPAG